MTFDDRKTNWANWVRDRLIIPVSCKSWECNYKAPSQYHYPEIKVDVDINDAIILEKELTSPTFPKFYMAIIVYANVYPYLNIHGAMRKINRFSTTTTLRKSNFDELLRKAELMLQNRLK